jgi:hypothetical protein
MTDIEMRISVLQAKAGDTLVFQFPRPLTREQRTHIARTVTPLIPAGVKALVLDHQCTVTHVAASEAHPAESMGFDVWLRERKEQSHREYMHRTSRLPPCIRRTYSADEIAEFYGISHGGID